MLWRHPGHAPQPTSTSDAITFAGRVWLNQQGLAAELKSHYDFIVCGAGTSGSVVAARLAADPKIQVLLLEAGGTDERDLVMNPNRWPMTLGSELDWGFIAEPNRNLNGRRCGAGSLGRPLQWLSVHHHRIRHRSAGRAPEQQRTMSPFKGAVHVTCSCCWSVYRYLEDAIFRGQPQQSEQCRRNGRQNKPDGALLVAASTIAAIRLRGEPVKPSPKLKSVLVDSVSLARLVLAEIQK